MGKEKRLVSRQVGIHVIYMWATSAPGGLPYSLSSAAKLLLLLLQTMAVFFSPNGGAVKRERQTDREPQFACKAADTMVERWIAFGLMSRPRRSATSIVYDPHSFFYLPTSSTLPIHSLSLSIWTWLWFGRLGARC